MDSREQIAWEYLGKAVHVVVDRPIGYLHGDILYPVNYGYIPGTLAGDGEEQDAYILGVSQPLDSFDGRVVAVIHRHDDCEDKLVVAPDGMVFHQGEIAAAVHFQEQYFHTCIDSLLRRSCGVLPWRMTENGREYLIVFEQFSQCWSLPKGHMEAGETETETALRELREETGLAARLVPGRRAVIEYPVGIGTRKQVVFFLGQVSGKPKTRDGEITHCKWVTAEELKNYLFPDTVAACGPLLK